MQLIGNYNQTVKKGDKSEYEQILKTAQEYNEFLYSEGRNIVTDAEYEPDAYYETLLKVDNSNIMCYIDIPSIDVRQLTPDRRFKHSFCFDGSQRNAES